MPISLFLTIAGNIILLPRPGLLSDSCLILVWFLRTAKKNPRKSQSSGDLEIYRQSAYQLFCSSCIFRYSLFSLYSTLDSARAELITI